VRATGRCWAFFMKAAAIWLIAQVVRGYRKLWPWNIHGQYDRNRSSYSSMSSWCRWFLPPKNPWVTRLKNKTANPEFTEMIYSVRLWRSTAAEIHKWLQKLMYCMWTVKSTHPVPIKHYLRNLLHIFDHIPGLLEECMI
jgi:hypothetical protein